MSNLSLSYDPTQTTKSWPIVVSKPEDAAQYLTASVMPMNLLSVMSKHESFRDATIGLIITNNYQPNTDLLELLAAELRANPSTESTEVISLCETMASLSFAWGDKDLAKQALLRINPEKATRYLKLVYTAVTLKNMEPESFKTMLQNATPEALNTWSQAN